MSIEHPRYYQAYVLRCWQEPPAQPGDAPTDWRFVLEKVAQDPQRYGFSSLEAVFAFLREALEGSASVDIVDGG